ncbi:COBRA-like protein 2 [Glycine soja]|nr:COBRA-like protein 2 [Glycine soja]
MGLNVHRVHSPTLKSIILLLALCTLSGARVTLQNYYQYRHVDKPGWKLGWTWANNEVIWSMSGAIATDRGNCSSYSGSQMPHSCKKDPTIVDLSLDASQNRSEHCCRGGLLSPWSIDPFYAFSSFELEVRNVGDNPLGQAPINLTLMAPGPGYTCSPLLDTDLSVSSDFGGLRQVPVLRTWKSTCAYSSFLANTIPVCCVSLSSFYNPAITSCRNCSCGCREADKSTATCIRSSSLSRSNEDNTIDEMIECTDHMCPVRVHWHFKNNYMNQWRVKLTISNYNYNRNYSNWNVLVQHPGFTQKARTYSFNSTKLPTLGLQGVDSIGTIPSALATYAAVLALQPYLIINAGTAGGFKIFDLYGIGLRKVFETPNLVKELNLKNSFVSNFILSSLTTHPPQHPHLRYTYFILMLALDRPTFCSVQNRRSYRSPIKLSL